METAELPDAPPPPAPPDDQELKNIIDKLSNFVARNGPEFETVTKVKQRDNPKFRFLFGEKYHDYYAHKVGLERALIAQQQQEQPPDSVETLHAKISALREQIKESETNLNAQNDVFQIKKKVYDTLSFLARCVVTHQDDKRSHSHPKIICQFKKMTFKIRSNFWSVKFFLDDLGLDFWKWNGNPSPPTHPLKSEY